MIKITDTNEPKDISGTNILSIRQSSYCIGTTIANKAIKIIKERRKNIWKHIFKTVAFVVKMMFVNLK